MKLPRRADRLRSLLPQAARERLYEWHPGRARRWQRYPGIERIGPGGRAVLTFDDGPDEDATPAVLDSLDQAGVRATFFVLGSQVQAHGDLARELVSRGHEVGLHGYRHERHDLIDPRRSGDDVRRGFSALEESLDVRCQWYRPPYGKMSAESARCCETLGMRLVYWSGWGLDWEDVGAGRIADVASAQVDDGSILLLHDSARYARRASAIPTAEAIGTIVERARERGLSFVLLRDVIPACEGVGT